MDIDILKRDPACVCVCACVPDSKTFLDDIKDQISSVTSEIPLDALSDVSKTIEQLQSNISKYTPDIRNIDSIR